MRSVDPYADSVRLDWPAELRCGNCGKLLAELVNRPFKVTCPRCKQVNAER